MLFYFIFFPTAFYRTAGGNGWALVVVTSNHGRKAFQSNDVTTQNRKYPNYIRMAKTKIRKKRRLEFVRVVMHVQARVSVISAQRNSGCPIDFQGVVDLFLNTHAHKRRRREVE